MTAPTYGDLREHLAAHLANAGLAQWRPDGIYQKFAPPACYLGVIPDEAGPSIGINVYHHGTNGGYDTGTPAIRVQLRIKGTRDPRYASRVADDIYQLLHEQVNYKLDNGTSVLVSQRVLTYEERDEASVYHRVDSYEFVVNPN
ncbi:minor capsid protein [Corynebacterium striatum]|uniref:minor capsid protein n=1 Tax=Corynebacterium striatum TaxID=43770 RepID=UPI0027B950C7|nr:minor capsid protein [Corynebacterium striatum]